MRNFPIVLTGNTRTLGKAAVVFPKRNVKDFENRAGDVRINWFLHEERNQTYIRAHICDADRNWRNFVIPTFPDGIVPYTSKSRIYVNEDLFGLIAALRGMTAKWANSEFSVTLPKDDVTLTGKVWAWADAGEVERSVAITPGVVFHPGDLRVEFAYSKPEKKKYIRVSVFNLWWRTLAMPGAEDGIVVYKSNASRNRALVETLRTLEAYNGRNVTWKEDNGFEIALTEEDLAKLEKRRLRLVKSAERTKIKNPDVRITGAVYTQGAAAFNFRSHELTDRSNPRNGDIVIWVPGRTDAEATGPQARRRQAGSGEEKPKLIRAAIFRDGKRCAFAMRDDAMAEMTFSSDAGRDRCVQRAIDVIGGLSGRHATWTKGTYFVPMLNPELQQGPAGPTEKDPVEAPPVVQLGETGPPVQPELDFNAPLQEGAEIQAALPQPSKPTGPTDLFGNPVSTGKPKRKKRK